MEGLLYLHQRNIAHRDIKLENIMFVSDDEDELAIKVIDFGFACEFDPEEGMSLVLGSPLYMAPEIVTGQTYTEKVDVWALGILTYVLVQGTQHFDTQSVKAIYQNTVFKTFSFKAQCWDCISADMKNFI